MGVGVAVGVNVDVEVGVTVRVNVGVASAGPRDGAAVLPLGDGARASAGGETGPPFREVVAPPDDCGGWFLGAAASGETPGCRAPRDSGVGVNTGGSVARAGTSGVIVRATFAAPMADVAVAVVDGDPIAPMGTAVRGGGITVLTADGDLPRCDGMPILRIATRPITATVTAKIRICTMFRRS